MMGSWKSTVGRKLAVALDLEFIDTDDAIEEVTEMKISDIFREFGDSDHCPLSIYVFTQEIDSYPTLLIAPKA